MEQQNRITLLSEAEINDFYARPSFDRPAQKEYFSLSRAEQNIVNRYRNVKSKIYFILQLGYFRAGRNFYDFNFENVQTDVSYVLKTYFHRQPVSIAGKVSRPVLTQQRLDILQLIGYQMCSSALIQQVEAHLLELLRYFPKGSDTLRELIGYFEAQKIVIPSWPSVTEHVITLHLLKLKTEFIFCLQLSKVQEANLWVSNHRLHEMCLKYNKQLLKKLMENNL